MGWWREDSSKDMEWAREEEKGEGDYGEGSSKSEEGHRREVRWIGPWEERKEGMTRRRALPSLAQPLNSGGRDDKERQNRTDRPAGRSSSVSAAARAVVLQDLAERCLFLTPAKSYPQGISLYHWGWDLEFACR
jgi:hypothetical protein